MTQKAIAPEEVGRTIEALFAAARDEAFEDGMESRFSRELVYMIKTHGCLATKAIAGIIAQEKPNSGVVSESMRWLGHIDDPPTHEERLHLLEQGLRHSSAGVRDGAALGLASLDDPRAIPALKRAIQQEQCAQLRVDMVQVVLQLEREEPATGVPAFGTAPDLNEPVARMREFAKVTSIKLDDVTDDELSLVLHSVKGTMPLEEIVAVLLVGVWNLRREVSEMVTRQMTLVG